VTDDTFIRLSEVRMERVGKRYGDRWALQDVSISVRPGEFYTLLGPPGSGKTTLLRAIAGFVAPDTGQIVVDDEPVDAAPPWKRNVGMVFPQHSLWPHMSVFENVAFGLRARREPNGEVERKVKSALAQVKLEGMADRRPSELSGLEEQRVALARAFVVQPRLLLLDEPLVTLDGAGRAEMRPELSRLHREVGITTLYATRERADAFALSSRIAVLSEGRVQQEGRPDEIYWRPRNRFVAEFVGAANLVPVRVIELRELGVVVETAGGARLPVPSGGHVWTVGARALLCLRPEGLRFEEAALAPGGIPGTVSTQVFEGSRQLFEIDITGGSLRVETITSVVHGRGFKPGDRVKVEVSPETSVLLPDEEPERARRM
jgi:ABC-type Fe3+/spermidine/putrescine transport system ATPase subunit